MSGQVGYLICNMRSLKEAFVGDTIHGEKEKVEPLAGFTAPKQMVKLIFRLEKLVSQIM